MFLCIVRKNILLAFLLTLTACSVPVVRDPAITGDVTGINPIIVSSKNQTETPEGSNSLLRIERTTPSRKAEVSKTPRLHSTATLVPSPLLTNTNVRTSTATPTDIPVFQICSPLARNTLKELPKIVSQPYKPPPMGSDERHQGVDFSYHNWNGSGSILASGVQSVLAGKVAAALSDTFPFGNLVIIETEREELTDEISEKLGVNEEKSLYILYAHLNSAPLVEVGERIPQCHPIGSVGRSGNALVAHLHLETRIGPLGFRFDGMSRFVEGATPQEKENYIIWRKSGLFVHFNPMDLLLFDMESGS